MRLGDRARVVRAAWLVATAGVGLATIVGSNSSSSESEPTFEPPPPSNLEVVTVEYPRVVFANGVATIAYNESTRRGAAQQFRARAFRFDPAANSTEDRKSVV